MPLVFLVGLPFGIVARWPSLTDAFELVGVFLLFGFFIGGWPAALIGGITGGLLSARLNHLPSITQLQVVSIGLQVGFAILAAVHLLLFILSRDFIFLNWGVYLFFLGFPSLIFLCLAQVVAHKMRPLSNISTTTSRDGR